MIRAGIRRAFRLALSRKDRWEAEVEEEIKLHLSLRAEQLMSAGATPNAAYDEAVRRFGPLSESRARLLGAAKHREQRMQRVEFFADLRQDLAFAVRTLSRQKGWTAVTLLTFALGIGATAAVFSVVSSLLIHAVPYPNADRVVFVDQQTTTGNTLTGVSVSIRPMASVVRTWHALSHSFEDLEPYGDATAVLETRGEPAELDAGAILPSFPAFAGTRPTIGRLFTDAEIRAKMHLVLLGEGAWRARFGADPRVLGRAITLDDSLYTIVGVLPASLRLPGERTGSPDVWFPIDLQDNNAGYGLIGRLRPGSSIETAARELDSLAGRSGDAAAANRFTARLQQPGQLLGFRDSLIMLMAAAALVLLVACANVAHLLLARSATRERELAIRAALGAGRARVYRQLLTESCLLTLAGGGGGVLLGWAGLRAMTGMRPAALSALDGAHVDATTFAIAIAVAAVCGLAFGVLGARRSTRGSSHESLKAGALSTSHSRHQDRVRSLLVISEMALSATLLVGATLLIRSVINLQRADLGFEPRNLYSLRISLPAAQYADSAARAHFSAELSLRLRGIPSVRAVSMASAPPGTWSFNIGALQVEGEAPPPPHTTSFINANEVDPTFFRTMGIRFVEGGTFTDTTRQANQVIVNSAFARKHWPMGQAPGHRMRIAFNGSGPWLTVVGVVAGAQTGGPLADASAPMLYRPPDSDPSGNRPVLRTGWLPAKSLVIRSTGGPDAIPQIRALLAGMDPHLKPTIASVEHTMGMTIAEPRFVMVLLTVFTLIALALAAVGLFGVMSYSVAQRTREIGIRVALGASAGAVTRMIAARGLTLAAVGAALGLAGAVWGTKLIEHTLHGVTRTDPLSFGVGALILIGSAVLACVVPTRRALRVDPVIAIRAD